MKEIQNALIPVCIEAVALAGVPRLASARDSRDATPITASNGKDQFLLVEASAPGAKKQPAKAPKVNVDKKGIILKGYDAVAYFKESRAVKGSMKHTSLHGGAIYRFASAENKADFDRAPSKYAPQYGGFCANNRAMVK